MWAELGERTIDGVCVWFFPSLFLFFCIFSSHHPLVFLMLFLLLLYFLKAQVFIMFTSYIFFSVFFFFFLLFLHTHEIFFVFIWLFYVILSLIILFFLHFFLSCCMHIVYWCGILLFWSAAMLLSLFSTLSFHHFHRTHTHRIHIRMLYLHRSIFYIFGCFLVFVLTSQLFKTSCRYISVLCVRLYANMSESNVAHFNSGCWANGSVQFFPSNFANDTLMPYSFAFETIYVSIGRCFAIYYV